MVFPSTQGSADMVRHAKLGEVIVNDYSKDHVPLKDAASRRRSNSREGVRRDSVDNVSCEKNDVGDEVSMPLAWQGDGVSMRVPCCAFHSQRHGKLSNDTQSDVNLGEIANLDV